jgi:hypothetical protein
MINIWNKVIAIILLSTALVGISCAQENWKMDFTPDMNNWYAFSSRGATDDTPLGLADWNLKPAGAKGRIEMQGDKLMLDDQSIKLWGLNNEYADCFPSKEAAAFRAAFYAKYGFNSIRLHKYNCGTGWEGFGSPESMVEFDPDGLDRFDYFCSELKKQGLYINLSSNFTVKIGPKDADRFEAFDDFFNPAKGWNKRHPRLSTGHGSIYLSPGLQSLHIEQIVKLLNHKNSYTGMTYAQDPAIAFVEIFNEDSVLFYGTVGKIQQSPIMREYISMRFADWLKEEYETEEAWRAAWKDDNIIFDPANIANEHLKGLIISDSLKGNIKAENFANGVLPIGQPWFYDAVSNPDAEPAFITLRPRMTDTAEFLIGIQDEFNQKVVIAIRETGYEGIILGSNWQAGSTIGHYWNLMSDRKVGIIDRHNYFGQGARPLQLKNGQNANPLSELDRPGSELVSSGLQQVADRPFMFSEWNVVQPNEWYLEGPAIIGTYGMGLQGWDVSYVFASYQDAGFSKNLDDVKKFSVDTPGIMGVMPIFARMVRRGDVKESDVMAKLKVSVEQLRKGQLDFNPMTSQDADLKSFDSDKVPTETIAAAKVAVQFTDEAEATEVFPLDKFRKDGGIVSSTGELFWTETGMKHTNHFTINTAGTKGQVGFVTDSKEVDLGGVKLQRQPGFGAVVVTAESQGKTLADDTSALILAMARTRNTGMSFNADGMKLETVGKGPILLEPIQAAITFDRAVKEVQVLDHNGQPTGRTATLNGQELTIDTANDKSPYYRVVFE